LLFAGQGTGIGPVAKGRGGQDAADSVHYQEILPADVGERKRTASKQANRKRRESIRKDGDERSSFRSFRHISLPTQRTPRWNRFSPFYFFSPVVRQIADFVALLGEDKKSLGGLGRVNKEPSSTKPYF
jgi:hypothetical protein